MNTINTLDTNATAQNEIDLYANWKPINQKPVTGIAGNPHFIAALEGFEDASTDCTKYSATKPGTPEVALQQEADDRWTECYNHLLETVDGLLAEARLEGAAAALDLLRKR